MVSRLLTWVRGRRRCLLATATYSGFALLALGGTCTAIGENPSVSPSCAELLANYVERWPAIAADGQEMATRDTLQRTLAAMELNKALECATVALSRAGPHAAGTANFVEAAAMHPECVKEMEIKSQAQTRCSQKWYKIAIHALSVVGEDRAAEAMFQRATHLRGISASARILWPSVSETPTVWIEGLRSQPVWDCSEWPFVSALEKAVPIILAEVLQAGSRFQAAYPYLAQEGTWQDFFLYRGHRWDAELCADLPATCRLLMAELPTRPGVPYAVANNEEVVVFRSRPGAVVGSHSGASNSVVNLHLTLLGGEGTSVRVGDEELPLRDGAAVCFQDSFSHSVRHSGNGAAERISLVVRTMHPDLTRSVYGAAPATDVVADLAKWDTAEELSREVERLRVEYRKLAQEVITSHVSGGAHAASAASHGCNCSTQSAMDAAGCSANTGTAACAT